MKSLYFSRYALSSCVADGNFGWLWCRIAGHPADPAATDESNVHASAHEPWRRDALQLQRVL